MALYDTVRAPLFAHLGVQTDAPAEDSLRQAIVRQWAAHGAAD